MPIDGKGPVAAGRPGLHDPRPGAPGLEREVELEIDGIRGGAARRLGRVLQGLACERGDLLDVRVPELVEALRGHDPDAALALDRMHAKFREGLRVHRLSAGAGGRRLRALFVLGSHSRDFVEALLPFARCFAPRRLACRETSPDWVCLETRSREVHTYGIASGRVVRTTSREPLG